jgi:branched-subunit amino acid transport protein
VTGPLWPAVVVASASCYALKVLGLSLPKRLLDNRRVQVIAALLPVALLAALIATQTLSHGQRLTIDARVPGVMCAVVAVVLRAPFLVVVALAAATTAAVRLWI